MNEEAPDITPILLATPAVLAPTARLVWIDYDPLADEMVTDIGT